MRIGELAALTGVSRRALRYYEEQELLVPLRLDNGYRVYADDAPTVVRHIVALLRMGFNSDMARSLLPCALGDRPEFEMCEHSRRSFEQRRDELEVQLRHLTRQRDAVAGHLDQLAMCQSSSGASGGSGVSRGSRAAR
ncbi:MerR family transcriptional regulator [Catenuloplanes japonicus]|uniref:MerR family transcriptional regulator n=1 Tax=Catenuloplanes japonicus TaxID=33876 RepID=UPI0007C5081A|nr:MerR family transcriptional regulator [Catenuloplanes japonicus]